MLNDEDIAVRLVECISQVNTLLTSISELLVSNSQDPSMEWSRYRDMSARLAEQLRADVISVVTKDYPNAISNDDFEESSKLGAGTIAASLELSDRATALRIQETMLAVSTLLNRSLKVVLNSDIEDDQKRAYRKAVGRLMGAVLFEALSPIWQQHPELIPPDMKPPC